MRSERASVEWHEKSLFTQESRRVLCRIKNQKFTTLRKAAVEQTCVTACGSGSKKNKKNRVHAKMCSIKFMKSNLGACKYADQRGLSVELTNKKWKNDSHTRTENV